MTKITIITIAAMLSAATVWGQRPTTVTSWCNNPVLQTDSDTCEVWQRSGIHPADTSRWHFGIRSGVMVGWGGSTRQKPVLVGQPRQNHAPRRENFSATTLGVDISYRASDRLTVWASFDHLSGLSLEAPVEATAISGGLRYAFSDRNSIEMHMRIVSDHYGTLPLMGYGHLWDEPYYTTPGFGYYAW